LIGVQSKRFKKSAGGGAEPRWAARAADIPLNAIGELGAHAITLKNAADVRNGDSFIGPK